MWILTYDKLEQMNDCERLECCGLPGFVLGAYLQEVVF
jgi:hypothetical protein